MLSEGRSYEVDFYEAVDFVENQATEWSIENKQLFRGVYGSDRKAFSIIEPSLHTRNAVALDDNVYNVMIDNMPSWDKYPKRHHSVYGSFLDMQMKPEDYVNWIEENYSHNEFGYVNFLIPEDNALVAVCEESDLRNSFTNGIYIHELPKYFEYMNEDFYNKELDFTNDWSLIDRIMKETSLEKLEKRLAELKDWESKHYLYERLIKHMRNGDYKTFYDYCDNNYSPENNDMELITYTKNNINNLKIEGSTKSREIWTEADCLIINPQIMLDFLNELYG